MSLEVSLKFKEHGRHNDDTVQLALFNFPKVGSIFIF